jgi:hypothetical protein
MSGLRNLYAAAVIAAITCVAAGFTPAEKKSVHSKLGVAANVLRLANAFKATLTAEQIAKLEIPLTRTASVKWTNIPGGASNRNGLEFSTLNEVQLNAAKAVIRAASGTAANEGYDEFLQIGLADGVIGKSGRSGYGPEEYIIAFLGQPSATGTWMLQFGGHHYAQNIVYNEGKTASATPIFLGGDPREWTTDNVKYAPLMQEHNAMAAMLASFSPEELAKAKINEKFGDVLLGTAKDGKFPATKAGIRVSELNAAAKAKVTAAMMPWLNDIDADIRAKLLKTYTKELSDTYITYSGNDAGVSGDPASFLKVIADYVRIDGPGVWIEFACQPGVYSNQPHYHTVFRDHRLDYNNLWNF